MCGRHTAVHKPLGCRVVGMSSLFYNTPAHTILFPSSLWISFKALPPPTILACTQCMRHMCTLLLLQGIHIIFNIYLFRSHPCIIPSSRGILSHLQWHAFISVCLSSSFRIKIKVVPAVLTLQALPQTNWPVNKVVANGKCWMCYSLSHVLVPHFEFRAGTMEWSQSVRSDLQHHWFDSYKTRGNDAFH